MFSSVYIGLSGMLTFSRGLDVISNNVSNLNTPGFKLNALQFEDLFYRQTLAGNPGELSQELTLGAGVTAPATTTRFTQGELRETGNPTDLAIEGNGFFVLRDGREGVYTRAGQFEFDAEGFLAATDSGGRVAGIAGGRLVDIGIGNLRTSRPQATATVKLVDNLSPGSSEHRIDQVEVFDTLGESHQLTLIFRNNAAVTPRSWRVEVRDADGDIIADAGEIRFSGDGSPLAGFNQVTFTFAPDEGAASQITLDMGEAGGFSGATSFSGGSTSTLQVLSQDGFGPGSLLEVTFDHDGVIQARYSNGQTRSGPRLALAWFDDLQSLDQLGGGLFAAPAGARIRLAAANEGVMGQIVGGTVEISNVELTQQFTDLIIIQRGFQASSQVLTTANEMMQQLIEGTRSRR